MYSSSAELYDLIYTHVKDYAAESRWLADKIRILAPDAHTLLDVGCGTGEHARWLTVEHGFAVDGLDLDERLVALAAAKVPQGSFRCADMINFDLGKRYDVIACLFGSIAYARDPEMLERAVRCMVAHLAPAGVMLVEPFLGPGALQSGRVTARLFEAPGLSICRMTHAQTARYHDWTRREVGCLLDDHSSCPRFKPQSLMHEEVRTIGDMVQSKEYRHMAIRSLALHAQRIGRVFAHPSTWSKLIREKGWLRPRLRLHPPKPRIGLRAVAPNEVGHVDSTIVKLLDGTKAYLHAVIDNYSRRILAWTVGQKLNPMNTCCVLQHAAACMTSPETKVYMDSGVENLNKEVDALLDASALRRVIAQIDISFSNSMIESWWRSLKHSWLYINRLDNLATLRALVEFYVTEHNQTIPHSAFEGQTPDEMYFGRGDAVPGELAQRRQEARSRRIEQNRNISCANCPAGGAGVARDAAG